MFPIIRLNVSFVIVLIATSFDCFGETFHACPDKIAADGVVTDANYGAEDGSSEVNCFDGLSDISWGSGAGQVGAGDTLILHGVFRNERLVVGAGGTSTDRLRIEFADGAMLWPRDNYSGSSTTISSSAEGGGHPWARVSGSPDVWKKAAHTFGFVAVWLGDDGTKIPVHTPTLFTADEATVVSSLQVGEIALNQADYEGLANTIYYRAQSSSVDVNSLGIWASPRTLDFTNAAVYLSGYDYIDIINPRLRGWFINDYYSCSMIVQDTQGTTIQGADIEYGYCGIKLGSGVGVNYIDSNTHDNSGSGVTISGEEWLGNIISAVTRANPGQVTTNVPHGLSSGEMVKFVGLGGMTQLNNSFNTVTVIDPNNFTIDEDTTSYSAFTSGGRMIALRTNDSLTVKGNISDRNCNDVNNQNTSTAWSCDGDGIGVGFAGGTVKNLKILNNVLRHNGPARAMVAGETGDLNRGSALYIGTSDPFTAQSVIVRGNVMADNHRYCAHLEDYINVVFTGNICVGTTNLYATGNGRALTVSDVPGGGGSVLIAGNVFYANKYHLAALLLRNNTASTRWIIVNNILAANSVGPSADDRATLWIEHASNANIVEGGNVFQSSTCAQAGGDYCWRRGTTGYNNLATWQGVGLGKRDSQVASLSFMDLLNGDFRLASDSPLIGAGLPAGAPHDYNGCRYDPLTPTIGAYESQCRAPSPIRATRQ